MTIGLRNVYLTCVLALLPAASFAQSGPVVRWNNIVGLITAPGVDNPVAGISSGGGPWTTARGKAQIDLSTGHVFFEVEGLVLNGGTSTGTAGPIANVAGTFICDTGTPTQTLRDTPAVALSATGDAIFLGTLGGTPPSCSNPLFLIRVAPNTGSPTKWIATGVVRQTDASGN